MSRFSDRLMSVHRSRLRYVALYISLREYSPVQFCIGVVKSDSTLYRAQAFAASSESKHRRSPDPLLALLPASHCTYAVSCKYLKHSIGLSILTYSNKALALICSGIRKSLSTLRRKLPKGATCVQPRSRRPTHWVPCQAAWACAGLIRSVEFGEASWGLAQSLSKESPGWGHLTT